MTNPNDPSEDRFQHPENRGGSGSEGDGGIPPYPSYPSTPHPEDAPGYSGYPGYSAYSGYSGYGAADWDGSGPQSGVQPQGTGRVDPMAAVRWGFSTMFRNWKIWVLGALVLVLLSFVGSFVGEMIFGAPAEPLPNEFNPGMATGFNAGSLIFQILFGLVSLVVTILVYHGALRQVDKPEISLGDFTRGVNLGPAIGLYILIQFLTVLALSALLLPVFFVGGGIFASGQGDSAEDVLAFVGAILGLLLVVVFLSLLVAPLTMLMVWYVVDRRATVWGAVREGFRAGLSNYGRLLLFTVASGFVMMVAALLTFGLALVLLGPGLLLAQAMIYRQAAGGALPAGSPTASR